MEKINLNKIMRIINNTNKCGFDSLSARSLFSPPALRLLPVPCALHADRSRRAGKTRLACLSEYLSACVHAQADARSQAH